jgi:hypothetical protein
MGPRGQSLSHCTGRSFTTGFVDKEFSSKTSLISRKKSSLLFPDPLSDINPQERVAAFERGYGRYLATK